MGRTWAVAAILLSLGLPQMAWADEAPGPLWNKACSKDASGPGACGVEQFAIAMPQKTVVVHIRFSLTDKSDQVQLEVSSPLGVLLGPGLSLSVDGSKPITLPYSRCSGRGCEASAVLDKSALQTFTHGKTLVVRYAVSEQAGANIPIKLDGLAAALKSLSH